MALFVIILSSFDEIIQNFHSTNFEHKNFKHKKSRVCEGRIFDFCKFMSFIATKKLVIDFPEKQATTIVKHLLPVCQIYQFRYIKIQAKTIDLSTRLWGINPTNSVFIPQNLVLRSIVLG